MINTLVPAPARPPSIAPALIQSMARELHVAANPEKHPRLRLMLADLSDVMQCCEEDLGLYKQ